MGLASVARRISTARGDRRLGSTAERWRVFYTPKENGMKTNRLDPGPAYESANVVARDLLQAIGERLQHLPPPGQATWYDVAEMCDVAAELGAVLRMLDIGVMEGD